MKRILTLVFMLVVLAQTGFAQACKYSGLSSQFSLSVRLHRDLKRENQDTSWVHISILNKKTGQRQHIRYIAHWLFSNVFQDCTATRSYQTGLRKSAEIVDGEYGDVVVADFNFDGLDDFAIKRDSGGNAGPTYIFYVQQSNGRFVPDIFLTERMEFFPEIHARKRMLVTYVHASAVHTCRTEYIYNPGRRSWRVGRRSFPGAD